jgi:hypothetical protein
VTITAVVVPVVLRLPPHLSPRSPGFGDDRPDRYAGLNSFRLGGDRTDGPPNRPT